MWTKVAGDSLELGRLAFRTSLQKRTAVAEKVAFYRIATRTHKRKIIIFREANFSLRSFECSINGVI